MGEARKRRIEAETWEKKFCEVNANFSTDGLLLLPTVCLGFASRECKFDLLIGWLFWIMTFEFGLRKKRNDTLEY